MCVKTCQARAGAPSLRAHHVRVVRCGWGSGCTTPHRLNPPSPRCSWGILMPRTAPDPLRTAGDSAQAIRPVGGREACVSVARFTAPMSRYLLTDQPQKMKFPRLSRNTDLPFSPSPVSMTACSKRRSGSRHQPRISSMSGMSSASKVLVR
jgi:hypothetical protein